MFTTSSLFLAAAALSSLVDARPSLVTRNYPKAGVECDLSKATLVLPQGLANLTAQSDPTSFVGFAFGVQNYTCTDGAFKSDGAVAKLFDVSCMIVNDPHGFAELPSKAIELWKKAPAEIDTLKVSSAPGLFTTSQFQGDHYFPPNPKAGEQPPIVPKWDFTPVGGAFHGNADATFTGKLKGSVVAPTGKQDINWLQLDVADGKLGKQVYRTDTREGQPPATCSEPGSKISVKYVSNYWFMGSSLYY
ncbi:hypothetical protein DL96DRAFT_1015821 [Flagelloscypha sp. PMI_526]|nr:hypothetical protein DL96DRAFT_1015821 [Flagelloscypha sp. PMI_526]